MLIGERFGLFALRSVLAGLESALFDGDDDADELDELIRQSQLLEHPAHWTWQDEVLVCDYDHAFRTRGGMPPEDLLLVTKALAA